MYLLKGVAATPVVKHFSSCGIFAGANTRAVGACKEPVEKIFGGIPSKLLGDFRVHRLAHEDDKLFVGLGFVVADHFFHGSNRIPP